MKPIEHGTDRGYRAHLRRKERACVECADAHNGYERARLCARSTPRELHPCGTPAAWRRHKRRDEAPCAPCVDAHRVEVAAYAQPKRRAA